MTWSISIKRVGNGDTSNSLAKVGSPSSTPSEEQPQQQSSVTTSICNTSYQPDGASRLAAAAAVPEGDHAHAAADKSRHQQEHQPSTFVVQVNPNSPISELHSSIEAVTGLKAHQQRLIYRGRILPGQSSDLQQQQPAAVLNEQNAHSAANTSSMRICDVTGLNDGHTIHLFPKKTTVSGNEPVVPPMSEAAANESANNNSATTSLQQDSASATASSLLSALFGIRSGLALSNSGNVTVISSSTNNSSGSGSDGLPEALANLAGLASIPHQLSQQRRNASIAAMRENAAAQRAARVYAARSSGNSTSRAAASQPATRRQRGYRDGVPPVREPGSLETIRQSLMTLHTMLGAAGPAALQQESTGKPNRTFFKGQWIDVKDTVNQWLEATVLEVVTPEDVLGEDLHLLTEGFDMAEHVLHHPAPSTIPRGSLDGFPIISMDDLEGRRSLLLQTIVVPNENGEGSSAVEIPRDSSASKQQLLLIHYNGWPHRWDEWIRSDSPRIRTFRSRTRHSSSLPFSAPTIHSVHAGSPPTHILSSDDEQLERAAVLPEVGRILNDVQSFLNGIATVTSSAGGSQYRGEEQHMSTSEEEKESSDDDEAYCSSVASDVHSRPHLPWHTNGFGSSTSRSVSRNDVQILAALFDRLGRTLIDLAPHVVSMATTFPDLTTSDTGGGEGRRKVLQSSPDTVSDVEQLNDASSSVAAPTASVDQGFATSATREPQQPDENVDFISGMVHTRFATSSSSAYISGANSGSQGARNGRDRAAAIAAFLENTGGSDYSSSSAGVGDTSEENDETITNADASSFPESLARLLAGGGNDGGGIDIHIHAVVTPGFLPGGGILFGGLTNADSGSTATADTTTLPPLTDTAAPSSTDQAHSDEDMGLFDELYGEPLDLPALEAVPASGVSQQNPLSEDMPMYNLSERDENATPLENSNPSADSVVIDSNAAGEISDDEALNGTVDAVSEVNAAAASAFNEGLSDADDITQQNALLPEQSTGINVDMNVNSSSNDVSPRSTHGENDVVSSENNEPGRERRDLLSVIRRYTLGRGS